MGNRSSLRIPRVALVTLTLGGSCGGDDGKVSDAKLRSVARTMCERIDECEGLDEGYTVDDCVDSYADDFQNAVKSDGNKCGNAIVDYYACYAKVECEEEADGCEDLYDKMVAACPNAAED